MSLSGTVMDVNFFASHITDSLILFLSMGLWSHVIPQLEKRGERRAEAEKLLAQAQEMGKMIICWFTSRFNDNKVKMPFIYPITLITNRSITSKVEYNIY